MYIKYLSFELANLNKIYQNIINFFIFITYLIDNHSTILKHVLFLNRKEQFRITDEDSRYL